MLEINFATIIFQIINFLVLAVGLYFLFFKNIIKRAKTRKKNLEKLEGDAQRQLDEASRLKKELENAQKDFEEKINNRILKARSELELNRIQILDQTKIEAEKIIRQAISTAESESEKTIQDFHEKLVASIIEIVKTFLHKFSPDEMHNSLIRELNERIWEMGKKEMQKVEKIRQSLKEREPELSIESAFPLTKEQQANFVRTFSALADKNVKIEIHINEELGSGVRVRLADFVVINSFASLLDQIKTEAIQEVNNIRLQNQ